MELFNKRIKEVVDFIGNGDVEQAVAKLGFLTEDFAASFHTQAILLQGEYKRMKRENIQRGFSKEFRDLENDIARRVLLLTEEIRDEFKKAPDNFHVIKRKTESGRIIFYEDIHEPYKSEEPVIIGRNIEKWYYKFRLGPLNFELRNGEITTVTGVNGSGKSTLLKAIAGKLKLTKGELYYNIPDKKDFYEATRDIGYLPQTFGFPPRDKARNIMNYTAKMNGVPMNEIKDLVDEYLIRLGLYDDAEKRFSQLSAGYRLRVELARILMLRPKVLILDEPLANLDFITRHLFISDIRNFTNSLSFPMTTIVSSHNIEEIELVADNYIVIDGGKVLFSGPKAEFNSILKSNIFEIISNKSAGELSSALTVLNSEIKVYQFGAFQILVTDSTKNLRDVLNALSTADVKLMHIQHISEYSKALLVKNYLDKFGHDEN